MLDLLEKIRVQLGRDVTIEDGNNTAMSHSAVVDPRRALLGLGLLTPDEWEVYIIRMYIHPMLSIILLTSIRGGMEVHKSHLYDNAKFSCSHLVHILLEFKKRS